MRSVKSLVYVFFGSVLRLHSVSMRLKLHKHRRHNILQELDQFCIVMPLLSSLFSIGLVYEQANNNTNEPIGFTDRPKQSPKKKQRESNVKSARRKKAIHSDRNCANRTKVKANKGKKSDQISRLSKL